MGVRPLMEKQIGDVIRSAREKKGIGRKELATILLVAESTVEDWERGRYRVPKRKIPLLEHVLSISEVDLLKMNGIFDVEKDMKSHGKEGGTLPVVKPGIHKLCGDCAGWTSNKRRNGSYKYGYCTAMGIMTERCDWCRLQKEDSPTTMTPQA